MKIDQGLASGLRCGPCATGKSEQREAPDLHCGGTWQGLLPMSRPIILPDRGKDAIYSRSCTGRTRNMSDNIDFGRRGFIALGLSLGGGWRYGARAASQAVANGRAA